MPEIEEGNEPIIELIDEVDATEYSIGFSLDNNDACLKFHNEFGVLSIFMMDSQGVYDLAQRLLRVYDKLEGL